ncbi:hypothetical protein [Natrarchaeobius oligotrophus]|uniref:Uncharacterized protein n=1 Tax=Natrarchaeobius chitinivorans TaxID=1679083 RepID=A0A3N6MI70_NATCH|nr:hypothetical protein [Natrarchaeobius chitinivorans]RQG93736.1 hypothetical protein EA472_22645 [Natrarchaeobius chitinivorans]
MSDEPTTITVTVKIDDTEYVRQVQGTHWARDDEGRVYVYNGETTILEVEAPYFVEAFRENDVETTATITS